MQVAMTHITTTPMNITAMIIPTPSIRTAVITFTDLIYNLIIRPGEAHIQGNGSKVINTK
jgi:hypothetical protein